MWPGDWVRRALPQARPGLCPPWGPHAVGKEIECWPCSRWREWRGGWSLGAQLPPRAQGCPWLPAGVMVCIRCAPARHTPRHPSPPSSRLTSLRSFSINHLPPGQTSYSLLNTVHLSSIYLFTKMYLLIHVRLPTSWAPAMEPHKSRLPRYREWRIINIRASILAWICPPLWGGKEACVTNHFCVAEFIMETTTFWINNCISRISRIYP